MITTGILLVSILITLFTQLPQIQISNQPTLLAAIDIVNKPANKAPKNKKKIDTPEKKTSAVEPERRKQKTKISGYQDNTFVYGEVKPLRNDGVQGFIYHPGSSKTYVYGKKVKNKLNLQDTDGNIYQMKPKGINR